MPRADVAAGGLRYGAQCRLPRGGVPDRTPLACAQGPILNNAIPSAGSIAEDAGSNPGRRRRDVRASRRSHGLRDHPPRPLCDHRKRHCVAWSSRRGRVGLPVSPWKSTKPGRRRPEPSACDHAGPNTIEVRTCNSLPGAGLVGGTASREAALRPATRQEAEHRARGVPDCSERSGPLCLLDSTFGRVHPDAGRMLAECRNRAQHSDA